MISPATLIVFLISITLFLSGIKVQGSDLQTILMTNWNENVKDGSEAHYDGRIATWDFLFRLRIPRRDAVLVKNSTRSAVLFRIELDKRPAFGDFIETPTELVLEDYYLLERVQYTDPYLQDRDKDGEVNARTMFDHCYSGNYQIKIYLCYEWGSCPKMIYVYDLGLVVTPLHEIHVQNMNLSFTLSSNEQGALVEFEVIYNNDTDRFLNFRDFLVELVDESDKNHRFKARTYWTRIEFRNCSEDYEIEGMNTVVINNVTCIHNLPIGNYTVSVTPIDSRCNIKDLNVYLEPIAATRSTKLGICRRTSEEILEVKQLFYADEGQLWMEDRIVLEPILVGSISGLLVILILGAIIIVFFERRRYWPFHKRLVDSQIQVDHTEMDLLLSKTGRVLLVYDPDDDSGRSILRERAHSLRQQLLSEGVAQVYDYCEEQNKVEGNYWITARLHDPAVRILILLSTGIKRSLDLVDQLMIGATTDRSNLIRRTFLITYTDIESPSDEDELSQFYQFHLPDEFDSLLKRIQPALLVNPKSEP